MTELALVNSSHLSSNLYPSTNEWAMMKEQASMLIRTGFLPRDIRNPEQALAIMLKGREVGMPAMQAFSHIHVIKGKPTLSAEGMLALIFKNHPQTKLTYKQNDNIACVIEVTKPGNEPSTFSFSFEDAKAAKITGKDNWTNYRRAMLRSRCVSEMARAMFPESLMGISYTPEELERPQEAIKIKVDPLTRIDKTLIAFKEFGIDKFVLEDLLEGADIQNLTEDQFSQLQGLYKELKSGAVTSKQLCTQLYGEGNSEPVKVESEPVIEVVEESKETASKIDGMF